jgi:hypothetical protein
MTFSVSENALARRLGLSTRAGDGGGADLGKLIFSAYHYIRRQSQRRTIGSTPELHILCCRGYMEGEMPGGGFAICAKRRAMEGWCG